jgi:D-beta-D-heptose 7-phosphate kinase/D-beta-D-heptose 1-phosphate adenosyltransferase
MTDIRRNLEPGRLNQILGAAEGKTVLVLGDVMLDRYLWGNASRISPEAPVPVVEVERESMRLGGAANVAHNVLSLKARPDLVAVVGDDAGSAQLRDALKRVSVQSDGLIEDDGRSTTLKTRIIARGQHLLRADQEDRFEVHGPVADRVIDRAMSGLEKATAVIISDYGKGLVSRPLLERVLPEARSRGIPVCVDPTETHFNAYVEVSVLTPNQFEAAEVLGYKLRDEEAVTRAGEDLLKRLRADCLLITRGEKGMSLFEQPGKRIDFPVVAHEVYDITGAGDTVVTGYTVALCGGAKPDEAALIATHAAGLVVSEVGTAVPSLQALKDSFGGYDG